MTENLHPEPGLAKEPIKRAGGGRKLWGRLYKNAPLILIVLCRWDRPVFPGEGRGL